MSRPPAQPVSLGIGERSALRLKHSWRLAREVGRYAARQRIWWLPPLIIFITAIAIIAATTATTLPYAVYTLF